MNAMRTGNETSRKAGRRSLLKSRVWAILPSVSSPPTSGRSCSPRCPGKHLATFRWLFPEDDLAADRETAFFEYLFVLANVEEYGADRGRALACTSAPQRVRCKEI